MKNKPKLDFGFFFSDLNLNCRMRDCTKRNLQNEEEERLFNKIVVIGEHDMYDIPDKLKRFV